MKMLIQNVIGTMASAYRRSKSVAMRGASGCVDSRSCAQSDAAAIRPGEAQSLRVSRCALHRSKAIHTMNAACSTVAHLLVTIQPCMCDWKRCPASVEVKLKASHLEQQDQVLGCRHGALHQHDQGTERVQRQPSQPGQPCSRVTSSPRVSTTQNMSGTSSYRNLRRCTTSLREWYHKSCRETGPYDKFMMLIL